MRLIKGCNHTELECERSRLFNGSFRWGMGAINDMATFEIKRKTTYNSRRFKEPKPEHQWNYYVLFLTLSELVN